MDRKPSPRIFAAEGDASPLRRRPPYDPAPDSTIDPSPFLPLGEDAYYERFRRLFLATSERYLRNDG